MEGTRFTALQKMRRCFRDVYASLPTTNVLEEDLAYATDTERMYRWNGSAWEAITALSPIVTGSYTGNDTANRAIPHGLTSVPSLVLIHRTGTPDCFTIMDTYALMYHHSAPFNTANSHAVTAMDTTNFYVGNGANYSQSANAAATAYNWTAF